MLKGDIIISINTKPVKDLYEYMERLSELKKGDLVDVEILRGTEKIILKVQM
jgi:S1-C subfamily serine protease